MSTVAYPEVRGFANAWEELFKSGVCAGICGDRAHQKRGGYHIGRHFQPPTNYSVVRFYDRPGKGPDDAATAVDMGLNRVDMVVCTRRLVAVFANDRDPRRKYLNAFNGWLGTGAPQRWDMIKRTITRASRDHTSHVHLEFRRAYARNRVAHAAVLSALRGETVAQYLISIGLKPYAPHIKILVPKYPGRVLTRSTSGKPDPAVKAWQQRMLDRGWKSIGKPDGKFGPKTGSVVRRYQKTCRVTVDGQIGPNTWPLPWSRPLG